MPSNALTFALPAVAVLVGLYAISIYNRLVVLRARFKNAFSQVQVQLQRRYDLIPNLVEIAKGYLAHERQTLEAVVASRNRAVAGLSAAAAAPQSADALKALGGAEAALTGALGRLNVVMEAYPELQASSNMQQLSEELTSTENRVGFARQAYNDAVAAYNGYKHQFPQLVVAAITRHAADATELEFADSAAIQNAPKVSFAAG